MKINKSYISLLLLPLLLLACDSEFIAPHDMVPKGGFVRFDTEVEKLNFVFDLTQEENPVFEAPIIAPSDNVQSYDLSFVLSRPQGNLGPFDLLSIDRLPAMLSFSLQDIADAAGLDRSEVRGLLNFTAAVTRDDGTVFTAEDFSGDLNNPGERQAMRFSIPTICPSDLAGTYRSVAVGNSTDGCCPNETTVESTVTLTETGTGEYVISDWSAGLYLEWYDVYGVTPSIDMSTALIEACGGISIPEFAEVFGGTAVAAGSVDPNTGIIVYEWENSFGDTATVTLTPQE